MGIGNIANTGMKASMQNMEIISNNIANSSTYGFKRSFANFNDLYANTGSTIQIGMGVQLANVIQDFSGGDYTSTNIPSNLSITNGSGFFITKDSNTGITSYTRDGGFQLDNNGYFLIGSRRLQGFPASNGVILAPSTADLQITNTTSAPNATTKITESLNLDSGASIISTPFAVPPTPSMYNFQTSIQVYDSLGTPATVSIYYTKTAAGSWTMNAVTGTPPTIIGTSAMTFDTNGNMTSPVGPVTLIWNPTTGATTPQNISLDFTNTTQYGGGSKIKASETQDGYGVGTVSGFDIDQDGILNISFTNGQTQIGGQVALALFNSPEGLQYMGDSSWVSTSASGAAIINQSTSTNSIKAGFLETSNVDLTEEMINLIDAQHGFQANAQVEQTYNEVMQTIVQL